MSANYKIVIHVDGVDGYRYKKDFKDGFSSKDAAIEYASNYAHEQWRDNTERRIIFMSKCELIEVSSDGSDGSKLQSLGRMV